MHRNTPSYITEKTMLEFADLTGLGAGGFPPRRYLWTDAFAVCNFIELFRRTDDNAWLDLALWLVGIAAYLSLAERIDNFWMDDRNRSVTGWNEHREINMVMLATSLAPNEFLTV